jgi:2-methylcitrate dehydratase PrpD
VSDALEALLESAGRLDAERVPPTVREHAARVLADTVGAMLAGGLEPEVRALAAAQGAHNAGEAVLIVPGLPRTAPQAAALVNGTAAVWLELDEGHRPTGHPASHIVPAALAVAQDEGACGRDLLTALIAGYEVTARLFRAYRLRFPLHCHGNFGAIGAAIAAARLRGQDPLEAARIAASLPLLTVWQACYEGATVRNTWSGIAAMVGVLAGDLAASGFTGSRAGLGAAFGELVGALAEPAALAAPLAEEDWEISTNYFKLHGCCASCHSAIDAALALLPVEAEQIATIEVETIANNLKVARDPEPNDLSRRFSLPYAVAAAIVHRHAGPAAFAHDRRVTALAKRVSVRADPLLERTWPEQSPARVTICLSGETRSRLVENPRGHWRNPAGEDELRAKFARHAPVPDAGALYANLLEIDRLADLRSLIPATAATP